MRLKPEERWRRGGGCLEFVKSLTGRGLGYVMLLGLGLFSPHFPIIFLVSLRERSPVPKQSPRSDSPHLPGGPSKACSGGPKGDPRGRAVRKRFCRCPLKVELIFLALLIVA